MGMLKKHFFYKRKELFSLMTTCGVICCATTASAGSFQNFAALVYSNPAELFLTVPKKNQLILGDTYVSPNITFYGTVSRLPYVTTAAGTGQTSNIASYNLPYGRMARKLSDQWMVGLDVTEPFTTNVMYNSATSIARYAVTKLKLTSVDVAPNVAYQFAGKLSDVAVGVGLDAMYLSADLEQISFIPLLGNGAPGHAKATNKANGWAYGWHAGAMYHALKGTFLSLNYFSGITPTVTGTSTYTGSVSTHGAATVPLPATSTFSLKQFLNPDLMMFFQAHYSQWNRLTTVLLKNTAGPSSTNLLSFYYHNSWRWDFGTRYQLFPRIKVGALVAFDNTPTNNLYRNLSLPDGNRTVLGLGAEYQLTPEVAIGGTYSHTYFDKKILLNTANSTGVHTQGSAALSGNSYGLQLTVNC